MKGLLTLVLAVGWLGLYAQAPAAPRVYTDAQGRYRLTYPGTWQLRQKDDKTETTFSAAENQGLAPAAVTLTVRLLETRPQPSGLAQEPLDSVWNRFRRLPSAQVLNLSPYEADSYQELRYDYTYTPDTLRAAARTRVLGRRLWRGGYEYRLEYRAGKGQDSSYLAMGRQLVESFMFTGVGARRYAEQSCDDKMYGIAALRYVNDTWEDDCRTIHEFSVADPSRPPRIHRQVLPFQSYALAKGFDNCLYSVTKAPTNAPEYVYRYNPATRQGEYTTWQLPAQGPETVWIAAATDERGDLYFSTADASKLVKVRPQDGKVQVVWATDPVRQAPYYAAIGYAGAGSHGNFCLDDANTLYQIYSTDGSLVKVNLTTRQPAPELTILEGLPERGGYSDLLFQNDAAGRRRLYLAGPKALYWVDMARREAHFVRRGIYTDLAGCNLFRGAAGPVAASLAGPGATTWRGRVLDAVTYQPLPQAQLRLRFGGIETPVSLTPEGTFAAPVEPARAYEVRIQLPGYLTTDSTYTARSGAYVQDLLVKPLRVGSILRLNNVQFEQGKTRLLSSSYPALDQLLTILKDNPALTIELRGHTDNVGDPQKNLGLSEQRVAAVRIYLIGLGIAPGRITGIGLGGAEPRASNAQETTRKLNRRVEFRVTGVQ